MAKTQNVYEQIKTIGITESLDYVGSVESKIKQKPMIQAGYKQTEVGVIPEDWDVVALGDLIKSLEAGTSVNSVEKDNVAFSHEMCILKTSCVYGGIFSPDENKKIIPRDIHRAKLIPRRDTIIISRMNTPLLVGECGYVSDNYPNLFLPDRLWMTKRNDEKRSNIRWLAYLLSYSEYNRAIKESATGTSGSMKNISKNSLLSVRIPFPNEAEQEAIAKALSDTDALIESLEQLIAKKRHIKQGAMQELLTGKKRLPGFDGVWEDRTFGEIFDFYPTATNARSDLAENGDTYYIHYGDIHTKFHNYLDFGSKNPPKIDRCLCKNAASLRNGDWVMVDASEDFDGVGKSIEVIGLNDDAVAVAGLHTFLLREKIKVFELGFKGHLGSLKSLHEQYLKVTTGMKVYGVSKAALKDLVLLVPSFEEQKAISIILSGIDIEITTLETKLAKTRQLKQGMMHELLTGRIRLI